MSSPDQLWGTFAVDDHLRRRAFVAETLLFDRLIVPIPAGDEPQAYSNWESKSWGPKEALDTVQVLGDLAVPVSWNKALRDRYRDRFARAQVGQDAEFDLGHIRLAADDTPAKYLTRVLLADSAGDAADDVYYRRIKSLDVDPAANVEIVAGYGGYGQLQADAPLTTGDDVTTQTPGATLLFGWDFVVPEESELSCRTLLERAVKLAGKSEFVESRREFHDWRRKLIANRTDPERARAEMLRCLAVFNGIVAKSHTRSRVLTALQVGAVAAPLADFVALGFGTASAVVIGLGAFVFDKVVPTPRAGARERVAALAHDSREALGWRHG